MRKLIIYGVLLLLLASCRKERLISATDVLEQNPQLEEVLEACGDDSLKRQAALFLLENLPYYYSYERSTALDAHLKTYELYGTGKYSLEEVQDSVRKLYGNTNLAGLRLVSDVKIKPDLLIDHLEWAFKVWREQPWGKNVSFHDFCEYILPYRIKDEPLKAGCREETAGSGRSSLCGACIVGFCFKRKLSFQCIIGLWTSCRAGSGEVGVRQLS